MQLVWFVALHQAFAAARTRHSNVMWSSAGDRHQEKRFRDWLVKCHSELDKSLRFEALADTAVQVGNLKPHACIIWQHHLGPAFTLH